MGDPNERMQHAVESSLNNLDKELLRPMRKEAFLCSAKCCDTAATSEQLQACVQNCQGRISGSEQMISGELEQFQNRLQRCAMACSDAAQDRFPSDPAKQTPELVSSLQREVENCANKCVDTHIASLGNMTDRIKSSIRR